MVLAALASGAIYLLTGNLTSGLRMSFSMSPAARRHLSLLAAAFLLLLAFGAWLGRAEYLVQPSARIHGASYADVHARMPVALVLAVAALARRGARGVPRVTTRRWLAVAWRPWRFTCGVSPPAARCTPRAAALRA